MHSLIDRCTICFRVLTPRDNGDRKDIRILTNMTLTVLYLIKNINKSIQERSVIKLLSFFRTSLLLGNCGPECSCAFQLGIRLSYYRVQWNDYLQLQYTGVDSPESKVLCGLSNCIIITIKNRLVYVPVFAGSFDVFIH